METIRILAKCSVLVTFLLLTAATASAAAPADPLDECNVVWTTPSKNSAGSMPLGNGDIGMIALQAMLLQSDGSKLFLLPAWPKAWDVEFRLRAPLATTVEGVYRGGKLERLSVTPPEREKDVVRMEPQ